MKQHITLEQLEKDPYKARDFILWLGISCSVYDGIFEPRVTQLDLEKINVEMMLFYFNSHDVTCIIKTKQTYLGTGNKEYNEVTIYGGVKYIRKFDTELIDAFWEVFLEYKEEY